MKATLLVAGVVAASGCGPGDDKFRSFSVGTAGGGRIEVEPTPFSRSDSSRISDSIEAEGDVTLTAVPDDGQTFLGWTDSCAPDAAFCGSSCIGEDPVCRHVRVDDGTTITAVFGPQRITEAIALGGGGVALDNPLSVRMPSGRLVFAGGGRIHSMAASGEVTSLVDDSAAQNAYFTGLAPRADGIVAVGSYRQGVRFGGAYGSGPGGAFILTATDDLSAPSMLVASAPDGAVIREVYLADDDVVTIVGDVHGELSLADTAIVGDAQGSLFVARSATGVTGSWHASTLPCRGVVSSWVVDAARMRLLVALPEPCTTAQGEVGPGLSILTVDWPDVESAPLLTAGLAITQPVLVAEPYGSGMIRRLADGSLVVVGAAAGALVGQALDHPDDIAPFVMVLDDDLTPKWINVFGGVGVAWSVVELGDTLLVGGQLAARGPVAPALELNCQGGMVVALTTATGAARWGRCYAIAAAVVPDDASFVLFTDAFPAGTLLDVSTAKPGYQLLRMALD